MVDRVSCIPVQQVNHITNLCVSPYQINQNMKAIHELEKDLTCLVGGMKTLSKKP